MTHEEIKAYFQSEQADNKIDRINVMPFVADDVRILVSFVCESYSSNLVEIEKLYTIQLGYASTFGNQILIGLTLTPKTASV